MKILIVSQYFWPENFRINDLAEELTKKDHEITVLTGIPNYPNGKFFKSYGFNSIGLKRWKKINIFRVPILPRFSGKSIFLIFNYFSYAFFASVFGFIFLLNKKFDVIFVYEPSPITVGIPAILIKKIKKIPIVFWVQDLWPESLSAVKFTKSKIISNTIGLLVKWTYKNCDKILIQSRSFVGPVSSRGAERNKIIYLPNWAETFYMPKLCKDIAVKKIFSKKTFNVVFAGNLGAAQSLETILKAADILKEESIRWIIIGDGRRRAWFNKMVIKSNLHKKFVFIGNKPAKKMPDYFSQADALLVTLSSDPIFSLTIPGKIQSYLACGKPIIAALDGEGAKVINKSGAGMVVNSENYKKLAKVTLSISKKKKIELIKMSKSGRKFYEENFDRLKLISKIEEIILKT